MRGSRSRPSCTKRSTAAAFEIKDYRLTGLRETPLYLTMNINPLLIDGKTPGILITSTDVTKRVELEDALKQYTVELEDKVDKGTATAQKLEQQVMHSEKLAALGRLSAGIAHEIGNPLTSISTFAQLLREMTTDEFTQNSLDIINKHIQRITDIVRKMSTFARADSLNIQYVQLNDVLQSTLDLMRLDKRMKNTIEILVSFDPDLPKTMIDEGQMSQVFINIILNALDAMPDGGSLSITTRQDRGDSGKDFIRDRVRRYRDRDRQTGVRKDLRSILHDQGSGKGNRSRPFLELQYHQTVQRRNQGRK